MVPVVARARWQNGCFAAQFLGPSVHHVDEIGDCPAMYSAITLQACCRSHHGAVHKVFKRHGFAGAMPAVLLSSLRLYPMLSEAVTRRRGIPARPTASTARSTVIIFVRLAGTSSSGFLSRLCPLSRFQAALRHRAHVGISCVSPGREKTDKNYCKQRDKL